MAGNHNSGRRPLPSEWKIINGTAKASDRKSHDQQPETPTAEPPMPDDIPEAGQWKWMETVELMRQMGTLSIAYADLLRMYAETWAVYLESAQKVRKLGTAFVTVDPKTKKVTSKPNPFERVMRQSRQDLIRMEAELGLTPAAKSRLIVPKTQGVAARKRHG